MDRTGREGAGAGCRGVLGLGCLQLGSVCGSRVHWIRRPRACQDADVLHSQDWRISAWAMKRLALAFAGVGRHSRIGCAGQGTSRRRPLIGQIRAMAWPAVVVSKQQSGAEHGEQWSGHWGSNAKSPVSCAACWWAAAVRLNSRTRTRTSNREGKVR